VLWSVGNASSILECTQLKGHRGFV
jgi:hypothetical protein